MLVWLPLLIYHICEPHHVVLSLLPHERGLSFSVLTTIDTKVRGKWNLLLPLGTPERVIFMVLWAQFQLLLKTLLWQTLEMGDPSALKNCGKPVSAGCWTAVTKTLHAFNFWRMCPFCGRGEIIWRRKLLSHSESMRKYWIARRTTGWKRKLYIGRTSREWWKTWLLTSTFGLSGHLKHKPLTCARLRTGKIVQRTDGPTAIKKKKIWPEQFTNAR